MNVIYKKRGKLYRRDIGDVVTFAADSKYISAFFMDAQEVLIDGLSVDDEVLRNPSLKRISTFLSEKGYSQFNFVHRSWLVDLGRVDHLKGSKQAGFFLVANTMEIPISRRHHVMAKRCFLTSRDRLKERFGKEVCYG